MTLAQSYSGFLLDLDGVVYRGDRAVPRAPEAVDGLRRLGRRLLFLTNNSARTPEQVADRLGRIGVPAEPGEVLTSAEATADMLARTLDDRTAYVIGEDGVRSALDRVGIEVMDGSADRVGAVVVGWDRSATYEKLRLASVLVGRGARLVATNDDASYPAPGGELWPGAGSLLAAVETATGKVAEVVGKPHAALFEAAVDRLGTDRVVMIGDRIETDLVGAESAGIDSVVVWSGAATPADLLDSDVAPVAAMADLWGLLEERPVHPLRQARPEDEEAVLALVRSAGLDPSEAEGRIRDTVVAGDPAPVATASADVEGDVAYVRSVAVREDLRGLGIGTLLVARATRRAAAGGARTAYLLTETAERFFAALGFRGVPRDGLPRWVLERSAQCSDTAVAMSRPLAPPHRI